MSVRGVELAVSDTGEGRPFVWGHGLTASMDQEEATGLLGWKAVADRARLVRYDARGHGRSQATYDPDDYRWPELAADLLDLVDTLGLATFVAGGASMGCATALHAALRAPERVDGLLLVVPPTAWDTRPAQAARYEAGASLLDQQGVGALADFLEREPLPPVFADIPGIREARRRSLAAMDGRALAAIFRGAARSDLPPASELARLAVPALVLAWADDPGHPVSTAGGLRAALPDAELHVAEALTDLLAWPQLVMDFVTSYG